jgi:hypothetical protein
MSAIVLESIRAFLAGDITPVEFRDRLYANGEFETFLSNDPHLKKTQNYVGQSVYSFLLDRDFEHPGDILSAQGALTDFLDRNGLTYEKTSKYADAHETLLSAQPRWLAVDPKYVQEHILPHAGGRSGVALKKWLRKELLERFKCVSRRPKWIQSPAWPISEHGPLVFLGQLEVKA